MTAEYRQKGETIEYTNDGNAAIAAGDVVSLTTRCGVAGMDIAVGDTGTLHTVGVFELAKVAAEITLGAAVYYDETNDYVTATSTDNIPIGWAVEAAAASDTACYVKLLG